VCVDPDYGAVEVDDEQNPCDRLVQSPVSAPVSLPTNRMNCWQRHHFFEIQIGGGPILPLSALQEPEELDYGSTSTETNDEEWFASGHHSLLPQSDNKLVAQRLCQSV
jgi:hypothetical protein